MNGEQLTRYIELLHHVLDEIEDDSPSLEGNVKNLRHELVVLERISELDREENMDTALPEGLTSYAKRIINKVLVGSPKDKHIDYSPMYALIARYGIKLSNMCDYLNINSTIRTSISKNETVHMDTLIQISEFLECEVNDLYTFITSSEKLNRQMKANLTKFDETTEYKGKDVKIPTAILREIKDTDTSANEIFTIGIPNKGPEIDLKEAIEQFNEILSKYYLKEKEAKHYVNTIYRHTNGGKLNQSDIGTSTKDNKEE
ncbi:hypothetical protein BLD48_05970 [Exiguobacterium sp. KRL4]|uniref:helix-turn-helix domain-containing protein n=1 Tax=Exiguobacterium sp. KRL4 TaxID=1914536 RepID=UPI0008F90919|nr:helix-turn-helix domain-containing protein [Exiguobacterium sp. KRL4]OIN67433.1 hypothetical protein BLD48_05970 [Exiguobacterium sp. KRL4]